MVGLTIDEDERPKFNAKGKKTKNSQLAVGYKDDLSFVVQGDMIGVFKQQRDGGKKVSGFREAPIQLLAHDLPPALTSSNS